MPLFNEKQVFEEYFRLFSMFFLIFFKKALR